MNKFEIIFASSNLDKLDEVKHILQNVAVVKSIEQNLTSPEENGKSFKENSIIKAQHYHKLYPDKKILSDDSGLEILELNNFPGIISARFAENDYQNAFEKLYKLAKQNNKNLDEMNARFVCVSTIMDEQKKINSYTGIVNGKIKFPPQGNKGFGYDPIFVPQGYIYTFAQMSKNIKNTISHRAKSIHKLARYLKNKNNKNNKT